MVSRGRRGVRARRRDRPRLLRPARDVRRRAARDHRAGRRADAGLPGGVALRGGLGGARLPGRLRHHRRRRRVRRRDLRAVGGVGEPVAVQPGRPSRGDRACRTQTRSRRTPGCDRAGSVSSPRSGRASASVDVERLPAGEEAAMTAVFPRSAVSSVNGATAVVGRWAREGRGRRGSDLRRPGVDLEGGGVRGRERDPDRDRVDAPRLLATANLYVRAREGRVD